MFPGDHEPYNNVDSPYRQPSALERLENLGTWCTADLQDIEKNVRRHNEYTAIMANILDRLEALERRP